VHLRTPPGRGRRPPNQGKKCDALSAPVQRVQIWVNIGIREMLTTKLRPLDVGSRPSIIPATGYSSKPLVWQYICRTHKYIRHRNVPIKFVAYLAYPQVYCGPQMLRNPAKKRRPYLSLEVTTSSCPTSRRVEGNSRSNKNGRWARKILLTTDFDPILLRNNESGDAHQAIA